jgi:hypothetical protein
MRNKDFDIKKEGNVFHIQRMAYPRMSLKIDYTNPIPQIKDINIQEECSAAEVKRVLSTLEDLIGTLSD